MSDYDTRICEECSRHVKDHNDEQMDKCWSTICHKSDRIAIVRNAVNCGLIPRDYLYYMFDKSIELLAEQNTESFNICKKWGKSPDERSLYLFGSCGTGKTHTARCALIDTASNLLKSFGEVKATKLSAMAGRFDEIDKIERYKRLKYLLIDDIDKPQWTAKGLSLLWDLIDYRADKNHKTIITSNVAPEKLGSVFRDAGEGNNSKVASLLDRLQPCVKLEFVGDSLRRKT